MPYPTNFTCSFHVIYLAVTAYTHIQENTHRQTHTGKHTQANTCTYSRVLTIATQVNTTAISNVDYIALLCVMSDMRLKLLEDAAEQQRV